MNYINKYRDQIKNIIKINYYYSNFKVKLKIIKSIIYYLKIIIKIQLLQKIKDNLNQYHNNNI